MLYKIGMFSIMTKTTIKTLRYYDKVGLLKPGFVDQENNYRYYTTDQLSKLHRIISLKQIGLSIEEILQVEKGENVKEILEKRKATIENNLEEGMIQLSKIKHLLSEKKEGLEMGYQAIIKELPGCIVYSKRMILPTYDSYFKVIPEIGRKVTEANPGLKCSVPEYCFNVYHDGEYKEENIDIEFCEAVEEIGNSVDGIVFKKVEAVTAASVMHKGDYSELGKAYSYIFKWIEDNGYKVLDNPRESYIDGIWNKEDKSEWLTEVQVPIVKK